MPSPKYLHFFVVAGEALATDYNPLCGRVGFPRAYIVYGCAATNLYVVCLLNDTAAVPDSAQVSLTVAFRDEALMHTLPLFAASISPMLAEIIREGVMPADTFTHNRDFASSAAVVPEPETKSKDLVDQIIKDFAAEQAEQAESIQLHDYVEIIEHDNPAVRGLIGQVMRFGIENCVVSVKTVDTLAHLSRKEYIVPLAHIRKVK